MKRGNIIGISGKKVEMLKRYKDFLALTKARKTTYEFSEKEVSKRDILAILEAARWAPSCGNSQPWHFIVVKNKKTIRQLVDTTHYVHAPFIHPLPPAIIAFVLPSVDLLHDRAPREFPHCCKDSTCNQHRNELELCFSMAVFSSTLTATDLGINSCILTPKQDLASNILKVKKDKGIVRLLVGFGYEKKNAFQKERAREKLLNLVSYEQYGRRA